MIRHIVTASAMLLAPAAHAASPCLTPAEAEAVVLGLAPGAMDALGKRCASVLPDTATLRTRTAEIAARYRASADMMIPQLTAGMAKLMGDEATGVDPAAFAVLLAGTLTGEIKTADCGAIDRAVTLLADTPPRVVSGMLALILELTSDGKGKSDFAVCKAAKR